MKYCWMSPIIRSENSVENSAVFWPWSSLRMSACTVPRTLLERVGRGDRRARPAWSMAVLRKNASTVGAGPLMVSDTDVDGAIRSKPSKSTFMSSRVATETPDVPTLP